MPRSGSRIVTQKDVARAAGVSSAVVSYVINNGPRHVSEEKRQRVLEAIQALQYRPNKFAQVLGKNDAAISERQIGIIIGGSSHVLKRPFYASLLAGIHDSVHEQGFHIRFTHFWDDLKDPLLFNEHIHTDEVSNLLILAADLVRIDPDHMNLITAMEQRIPNIVCLDTQINSFTTITFDRVEAARKVVTHFISLGHRKIAFVGNSGRRVSGYMQTLRDHGVEINPQWVQHPGIYNSPEEGYHGAQALLALDDRPTAIFAASDDVAIGVMSAIQTAGLSVPSDLAVAGVDDNPYADYLFPRLTTVHVPSDSMGAYALQALTNQKTAPTRKGTTLIIDTRLIVRDSCGAHLKT